MKLPQGKLTYANVVSTLCLFLLVAGGTAFAANQLAKNSVGSKQLKKNAVTTAKIKNEAITGAKIKKGAVTGAQIATSTLGTVPSAQSADTATTAKSLGPPEAWHQVGAPGEPAFQNGWANLKPGLVNTESAAFYKDQIGVVHLRGVVEGTAGNLIFQLPTGFRPADGRVLSEIVVCSPCGPSDGGQLLIAGTGAGGPGFDGALQQTGSATTVSLDGITFRPAG